MKETFQLFKKVWKQLFLFEIVYKLVTSFIVIPLVKKLVDLIFNTNPEGLLLDNNILSNLNPLMILGIILILILVSSYFLLEIGAILMIIKNGYEDRKEKLFFVLKRALFRAKDVLKPKNLWLIPFSIFVVPLTNIFLTSGFIPSLIIPESILNVINKNALYSTLFNILGIFLTILSFFLIFIYNGFFTEKKTANQSAKESFILVKHRKWRTLKPVIVISFLFTAIYAVVLLTFEIGEFVILNIFNKTYLYDLIFSIYTNLKFIGATLISITSIGMTYCRITKLYYLYKKE